MRERIAQQTAELRNRREALLADMPLAEIVDALDAVGRRVGEALQEPRVAGAAWEAELCRLLDQSPVPSGVRDGVRALAGSLRREALWPLLQEELGDPQVLDGFTPRPTGGWVRAMGPGLIGHFFAGNTPLLAWPSIAAGLLAKSAVFGKLSSRDTEWPGIFRDAIASVHPALGGCIALEAWPGGRREMDGLLCRDSDTVVAFGADATIAEVRALTPAAVPFHGYGHRISIGLVLHGADEEEAAAGLARDVLLYDQQGCLSAAMLFVEGGAEDAARFCERLARALERQCGEWRLGERDLEGAARVRSCRETALFAPGDRVWGDSGCRWSILLDPGGAPEPHGGECVVPAYPITGPEELPSVLAPLRRHLQGAALAAPPERASAAAAILARIGVSRICPPGSLQAPPFSWHHNGVPVLRHLLRWVDLERSSGAS